MAIRRIAVIMAMRAEAEPVIDRLGLRAVDGLRPELPMERYAGPGESPDDDLLLVVHGEDPVHGTDCIGTQPAALAAFLVLDEWKPDLLVNAGTAGGFADRGARVGDVYAAADRFVYHDRRIPLPGFEAYGRGGYPAPDVSGMAEALGLKQGVVSTGNALDMTSRDREIMAAHDAEVKEMEAAAVAWVARLYGVPLLALKAITDLVDRPESERQFAENLARASRALEETLARVIDYCRGRTMEELGGEEPGGAAAP